MTSSTRPCAVSPVPFRPHAPPATPVTPSQAAAPAAPADPLAPAAAAGMPAPATAAPVPAAAMPAPADATAAPGKEPTGVTLFVCTTCRGPDGAEGSPTAGEHLLQAVRAAAAADGAPVRIEGIACLANCDRRLSVAFVADGGWTYAFGSLVAADADDLIAGARMLGAAGGAMLPWRGRPDCLKRGMVARVPPVPAIPPVPQARP